MYIQGGSQSYERPKDEEAFFLLGVRAIRASFFLSPGLIRGGEEKKEKKRGILFRAVLTDITGAAAAVSS